jgi:hypothetical protein
MNHTHLQSAVSIESLAMLSSVVSKHGDDDTLKALAGILAEMGKPKTAEAVLTARREALAEIPNPKNLPTESQLASTLRSIGSYLYVEGPAYNAWHGGLEIRAETSENGACTYDRRGRKDLEHAEEVAAKLSALWPELRIYTGNTNKTVWVSIGEPLAG